ncbi:hypothetical protein DUNSADRAFT_11728 [Dunaliella salina]|uniref:Encoded protein n=1 Tax=Dunaliella salina TaxID=3046 RepID=A0ABQ7GCQ6_DUNSA|nr:hypothetical protein DUNSADRAFT_11728 [Dunaliella salina]|eukprot:KAF5832396.1 hypothetical protein DUNSADRAFT_11728 [Dunaliella salina]
MGPGLGPWRSEGQHAQQAGWFPAAWLSKSRAQPLTIRRAIRAACRLSPAAKSRAQPLAIPDRQHLLSMQIGFSCLAECKAQLLTAGGAARERCRLTQAACRDP